MIQDRDLHLKALKEHLAAAQNRMKLQADKKRTPLQFTVGQKVLLKLQPYVQTSVANRPYPKIAFKYYGPYDVVERIGQVAYKLQLPEGSLIHPVFHISQLKAYTSDYTPVYTDLPKISDLTAADTAPEAISDRRLVKKGNVAIPRVKIKWAKLPTTAAAWEDYNVIKAWFPGCEAWGQAEISAGGDVTPMTGSKA
jgi:hypothetical protein